MRTCRTSASSAPPSGAWSSTSTTSMRRLPGPWEWDVKRLAASMEVAARGNGFGGKDRREIVTATVASYRQAMRTFAKMSNLDVWYAHADVDQLQAEYNSELNKRQRKTVGKGMAKARTADSMQEVAKLTHLVNGRPQIIADPPLIVPIADLLPKETDQETFEAQIKDLLATYRRTLETDRRFLLEQYEFADMARKVVGVGSVGTRCWIVLMLGRDDVRSAVPAGQGGRGVGAQPFRGGQHVHQHGPAGGRRAAADAGIQRYLPGLAAGRGRAGRPAARLLRPPAAGLEILHRHRGPAAARDADLRRDYAGGRWRGPTPGPGTGSRSPPTWAARTSSTRPSPGSPPPTPTRTNATTRLLDAVHQDGSPPSRACDIGGRATRRTSPHRCTGARSIIGPCPDPGS